MHARLREPAFEYLRAWGRQTRSTLEALVRGHPRSGAFAPSCLAHAANLRFSSAPTVGGWRLVDAMHVWYFGDERDAGSSGAPPAPFAIDACGELPCTNDTAAASDGGSARESRCPLLDSVRACHSRCKQMRRRRRIRLGLNPNLRGHNVCQVEEDSPSEHASASDAGAAGATAQQQIDAAGGAGGGGGATAPPSGGGAWRDLEEEEASDRSESEQLDSEEETIGGGGGGTGRARGGSRGRRRTRAARRRRAHGGAGRLEQRTQE